jgi:DNA-binding XRE family transcriptional regulator
MKRNNARSEFAAAVGARIKQARQETDGMRQRELADLLGVSERSVIAYENGDVIPYRFLRQIEEVTSKSSAWILHGDVVETDGTLKEIQDQLASVLDQIKLLRVEIADLSANR